MGLEALYLIYDDVATAPTRSQRRAGGDLRRQGVGVRGGRVRQVHDQGRLRRRHHGDPCISKRSGVSTVWYLFERGGVLRLLLGLQHFARMPLWARFVSSGTKSTGLHWSPTMVSNKFSARPLCLPVSSPLPTPALLFCRILSCVRSCRCSSVPLSCGRP